MPSFSVANRLGFQMKNHGTRLGLVLALLISCAAGRVKADHAFRILPLNDYSGQAAIDAGRPVLPDRLNAPFGELRDDYRELFPPRDECFFLIEGALYSGLDRCKPPDLSKLIPRLHQFRPESWAGWVFANLETGCFENIRIADSAAAYDPVYAAWVSGIKQAWPNAKVLGYFLPGATSYYMGAWSSETAPPQKWLQVMRAQTQSIAALDGFCPEFYWPYDVLRDGQSAYESTLQQYRRSLHYIVRTWPEKLIMPVTWLSYYHIGMPTRTPCGEWRPVETWNGKTGEANWCGYVGLSQEQGIGVLQMIYDEGADGIFNYSTATDWGMWQQGHKDSHMFDAYREFVERNPNAQQGIWKDTSATNVTATAAGRNANSCGGIAQVCDLRGRLAAALGPEASSELRAAAAKLLPAGVYGIQIQSTNGDRITQSLFHIAR